MIKNRLIIALAFLCGLSNNVSTEELEAAVPVASVTAKVAGLTAASSGLMMLLQNISLALGIVLAVIGIATSILSFVTDRKLKHRQDERLQELHEIEMKKRSLEQE